MNKKPKGINSSRRVSKKISNKRISFLEAMLFGAVAAASLFLVLAKVKDLKRKTDVTKVDDEWDELTASPQKLEPQLSSFEDNDRYREANDNEVDKSPSDSPSGSRGTGPKER